MFFSVTGAMGHIPTVIRLAPSLFLHTLIQILVHFVFTLSVGKFFKLPLREIVLASNANVGGLYYYRQLRFFFFLFIQYYFIVGVRSFKFMFEAFILCPCFCHKSRNFHRDTIRIFFSFYFWLLYHLCLINDSTSHHIVVNIDVDMNMNINIYWYWYYYEY